MQNLCDADPTLTHMSLVALHQHGRVCYPILFSFLSTFLQLSFQCKRTFIAIACFVHNVVIGFMLFGLIGAESLHKYNWCGV